MCTHCTNASVTITTTLKKLQLINFAYLYIVGAHYSMKVTVTLPAVDLLLTKTLRYNALILCLKASIDWLLIINTFKFLL